MNQLRISTIALLASLAGTVAWAQSPPPPGPPNADGPPMGMKMPSPEERFKELDTNHDGKVSKEEFMSARMMMMGHHGHGRHGMGPPPGDAPAGTPPAAGAAPPANGAAPPADMQHGPGGEMRMRMEKMRAEHFAEMDKNGDGFLSADEFKQGVEAMRARHEAERAKAHGDHPEAAPAEPGK